LADFLSRRGAFGNPAHFDEKAQNHWVDFNGHDDDASALPLFVPPLPLTLMIGSMVEHCRYLFSFAAKKLT
jgi:hypothetical protein